MIFLGGAPTVGFGDMYSSVWDSPSLDGLAIGITAGAVTGGLIGSRVKHGVIPGVVVGAILCGLVGMKIGDEIQAKR